MVWSWRDQFPAEVMQSCICNHTSHLALYAQNLSLPLIRTECLISVNPEAEIWQLYSPASAGSAKEITRVFPFSVSSNLTLASSLSISWLPTATMSLPFRHRSTNPSAIRKKKNQLKSTTKETEKSRSNFFADF